MMDDRLLALLPSVSTILATGIGWTLAIATKPFERWFAGPDLSLAYSPEATVLQTPDRLYFRLKVANRKYRFANNCRVFLTSIQETKNGKIIGEPLIHDSFQVPWAGGSFRAIDLPSGISKYVDILRISKHVSGVDFRTQPPLFESLSHLQGLRGTYRLTLLATADGAKPVQQEVEFSYDGNWEIARLWVP